VKIVFSWRIWTSSNYSLGDNYMLLLEGMEGRELVWEK